MSQEFAKNLNPAREPEILDWLAIQLKEVGYTLSDITSWGWDYDTDFGNHVMRIRMSDGEIITVREGVEANAA